MQQLKSNTEWKQWGKVDPLWSVATWAGKKKDGVSPWTDEEFYALGESDWTDFSNQWRQYGFDTKSCVEIGCGTGRFSKAMAGTFGQVFAVDVSEDMLDYAQNIMATSGISNVEFSLVDGLHLPHGNESVACVFSAQVIQHLDTVEDGYTYFRDFHRVLEPGGTLLIHLPLYQHPREVGASGRLFKVIHQVHTKFNDVKAEHKRRTGKGLMRYTSYSVSALSAFLTDLGFTNIEFRFFSMKSNGGFHTCVLATKSMGQ